MSDTDWDETPETGASMTDETAATPEDTEFEGEAPEEVVNPQVRVTEPGVDTFVVPDLAGLAIGRQWHEVSADQLEQIQAAARTSGVAIEVKEDSQDAE